jgi:hypothetical protein
VPRLLVDRFTEDSVEQFRISASIRNEDAWALYYNRRFTAAIYLWGYAVEMTLKTVWFSNVLQYDDGRTIARGDLRNAGDLAKSTYNIAWHGLHDLKGWAELIVLHRNALGRTYINQQLQNQIQRQSNTAYSYWREVLRYKKNQAYRFEAERIAEIAKWFLLNSRNL